MLYKNKNKQTKKTTKKNNHSEFANTTSVNMASIKLWILFNGIGRLIIHPFMSLSRLLNG